MGWTVETQLAALAAELPTYTANLKQKMAQVRQAGTRGVLGKIGTPSRTSPARGSRARRPHRPRRRPCRCRPRGHHFWGICPPCWRRSNRLYGARPGDLSAHRTGYAARSAPHLRGTPTSRAPRKRSTKPGRASVATHASPRQWQLRAAVWPRAVLPRAAVRWFCGGFWRPSCGLSRMWGRLWRRCSPSGSASPSSPAGRSRSWSLACLCCWNWAPARCSNPCSWPQCRHLPGSHSRRRALLVLAVGAGGSPPLDTADGLPERAGQICLPVGLPRGGADR